MLWLFFNADHMAVPVEFHDSEPLRIIDIVAEYSCPLAGFRVFNSYLQSLFQSVPCEYIVPQDHGDAVISDKLFAYNKGLGKAVGTRLFLVRQSDPKLVTVSQKHFEPREILRCRDHQDIPNPCIHEH